MIARAMHCPWGRLMLSAVLALLCVAAPALAQPDAIILSARPQAVTSDADGREWVLRFERRIPAADIPVLEALGRPGANPQVEGVAIGFDAVRLRLASPGVARLVLRGAGAAVVIEVTAAASNAAERRLRAAEAGAAQRRGDLVSARRLLSQLLAETPDDPALLTQLAMLEAEAGRVDLALRTLNSALGVDPGATGIAAARQRIAAQQGAVLRAESFGAAAPNGERVASLSLSGSTPVVDGWRASIGVETRYGAANALRRSGESVARPLSVIAPRGEVRLERRWESGAATSLGVLASAGAPGVAVSHVMRLSAGELALSGTWNQPWWDTLMALQAGARMDRATAEYRLRPAEGVTAALGVGYVRYGVPGRGTANEGPTVNASISWTPPRRLQPFEELRLRLGYSLLGEYLGTAATLAGLPILDSRTREVHTLDAVLEGPLGPTQVALRGGWAFDRFGGNGPVGLVRVTSQPGQRVSYGAELGVGPSLANQARPVWRAGGFVAVALQ